MKRLRLLSDKVLVYLWRIGNGLDKPIKGRVWWAFRDENLDTLERLDFTLLKLEGILDVKTTLSDIAIKLGYKYANQFRNKVNATGPFYHSPESVKSLLDQADNTEKYFKYLQKKYGKTGNISYKDILRISKYYSEVKKYIYTNVIVQAQKIENLKRYLGKYLKNYNNRNLDGQERLALADVYANIILKRINSQNFIETYGLKRVSLDSNGTPFFAHSMLYLDSKRIIKLLNIQVLGDKITATFNNLVQVKADNRQSKPTQSDIKQYEYDAFISHASEDKNEVVRPLAEALTKIRIKVWYDEFSLEVGDSLKQKITEGLVKSKYGIVILSENFFNKNWPKLELNALTAKAVNQEGTQKVILPVWHNITKEKIIDYDPILADIVAENTAKNTISEIATKLKKAIND